MISLLNVSIVKHVISQLESDEASSPSRQDASERQEIAVRLNPASSDVVAGPVIDTLIGDTRMTSQYGILGRGNGRIVSLDLNGVNTISLFGVQGAGKSYTIGSIVEMATQQFPYVNQLPHPLATVIFHYHESQNYIPEFVSMVKPNNREDELSRLRAEFGAEPAALSDVLVLTSSDKVAARQMEYPNVEVHPISFRSSDLTARDWQFLMGAVGNSSLLKVNYQRTVLRIRSADQSPCLMPKSGEQEKGFWSSSCLLVKRVSSDNKGENACQLRPGASVAC